MMVIQKFYIDNDKKSNVLHPAIMYLKRSTYWALGGCDEDFVGNYGHTDPHFWFRCKQNPNCHIVQGTTIDYKMNEKKRGGTANNNSTDYHHQNQNRRLYLHMNWGSSKCSGISDPNMNRTCWKAIQSLVPAKKETSTNADLFKILSAMNCWSNRYLRFDWTMEI